MPPPPDEQNVHRRGPKNPHPRWAANSLLPHACNRILLRGKTTSSLGPEVMVNNERWQHFANAFPQSAAAHVFLKGEGDGSYLRAGCPGCFCFSERSPPSFRDKIRRIHMARRRGVRSW